MSKYEAPDHVAHRIHDALARYSDDEDKATHIESLVAAHAASQIGRNLAALLRD